MGYAGDITPKEASALLKSDPKAQLVDVRSAAEWTFVGVPDLNSLQRKPTQVEWQVFPGIGRNAEFDQAVAERLKAEGVTASTPITFLPVGRTQQSCGDRHDGAWFYEVLQRGRRFRRGCRRRTAPWG